MTHEIIVMSNSSAVQYNFVADEFSDRTFNVDSQLNKGDTLTIASIIDQVAAVAVFSPRIR